MMEIVRINRIVKDVEHAAITSILTDLAAVNKQARGIVAAGSAISSLLGFGTPSDIDVFIGTEGGQERKRVQIPGQWKVLSPWATEQHLSSCKTKSPHSDKPVQVIEWHTGECTVRSVLESFDFTICQFACDCNGQMWCNPNALIDLHRKRLVVHSLPYPVSSLQRLTKYVGRGYRPCSGTYYEIAEAIRRLTPEEYKNQWRYYADGRERAPRRVD